MSEISYNGISLSLVKTNDVQQQAVFDESGIDYLYTRISLDISCLYNAQATSYEQEEDGSPLSDPGHSPANTNAAIRHYLMQPRKQLTFSVNGDNIISSPDIGMSVDANNGPMPITCNILRIDGTSTFHVRYVIETWIVECPNPNPSPILANRWSQETDTDSNDLTTRYTRGTTYFRTDMIDDVDKSADSFRAMAMTAAPACPKGFRRTRINAKVDPRRNILRWEFVDTEQWIDIGDSGLGGTDPISGTMIKDIQGTFAIETVSSSADDKQITLPNGQTIGTMNVHIWGNKQASSWEMMQVAFQLVTNQMPIGDIGVCIVRHIGVIKDIRKRYISVNIQCLFPQPGGDARDKIPSIRMKELAIDNIFGVFNGKNPQPPNDSNTRGTAPVFALCAALKSACSQIATQQTKVGVLAAGAAIQDGQTDINVVAGDIIPDLPSGWSENNSEGPFTYYYIQSNYINKAGIAQLPTSDAEGAAEIVQLHGPIGKKVVSWTAERWGIPPIAPEPEPNDPNLALADTQIGLTNPNYFEDGNTVCFETKGVYTYYMAEVKGAGDILTYDAPPNMTISRGTYTLGGSGTGSSPYDQTIIDGGETDTGTG